MDPAVRRLLRPRRRRHRALAHRHGDDPHAGLPPRRLARRRRGGARPHEALLRAHARPRGVHGRRLRRHRRLPVLRLLRGDAHPGVLPHRAVRRPAPPVRRGEVPPVLPRRWARHARRGHRRVRRRTRWRAGLPRRVAHGQPRREHRRAALDVRRLLHRVRRQGADVAGAHLAARRRGRVAPGDRRAPRRRARQGRHLRDDPLLPPALPGGLAVGDPRRHHPGGHLGRSTARCSPSARPT